MPTHLSHKFLGGDDQLMIQHPARKLLKQTAVRVDGDRLVVLGCLVLTSLGQAGNVVEVACGDSLYK
jgi:Zn-dependent alcohol dehydrogenase